MKALVLTVKVIGLFLLGYGATLVPLYTSYYFASGNLTLKFFLMMVLAPFFFTLIISFVCIFKANSVVKIFFQQDDYHVCGDFFKDNNSILNTFIKLLCVYLLFISISDITYGLSYFWAVQGMVNDESYIDPEGLGKMISGFVELIIVFIVYKWRF